MALVVRTPLRGVVFRSVATFRVLLHSADSCIGVLNLKLVYPSFMSKTMGRVKDMHEHKCLHTVPRQISTSDHVAVMTACDLSYLTPARCT